MAIVLLGPTITGIRGKLGGIIASANKSGPYFKPWARGSNPRTNIQQEHRSQLISMAQAWKGITFDQKNDWDTYAALPAQERTNSLGELYSVSGFNWFVQLNLARQQNSQSILEPAPVLGTPAATTGPNMGAKETGGPIPSRWFLGPGSTNANEDTVLKLFVGNSVGIQAHAEIETFLKIFPAGGVGTFINFQDEAEEHFGTIQIGQVFFGTLQIQNSEGRRGAILADRTEVD